MGGKKSRDKGARFERFLVLAFKACFPDTHRGQQAHNPRHCDVEGTPFRIEAKAWAKLSYKNVLAALKQAEDNGNEFEDRRIPIAITKLDGTEPIIHITLRYFLQLIEKHFWREPEVADVIPISRVVEPPPEPVERREAYVLCGRAGCKNAATLPHPCPFKEEIHNDSETLCTCCDVCSRECAHDV